MPAIHIPRESPAERLALLTRQQLKNTMLGIAGDPVTLLEVVCRGPIEWRNRFLASFRGWPVDADVADRLFAFFSDQVLQQFKVDTAVEVEAPKVAADLLDRLEMPTPPTPAEIDAAWEIESHSSEEGRRHFYGRSSPQEVLAKFKAGARPEDVIL